MCLIIPRDLLFACTINTLMSKDSCGWMCSHCDSKWICLLSERKKSKCTFYGKLFSISQFRCGAVADWNCFQLFSQLSRPRLYTEGEGGGSQHLHVAYNFLLWWHTLKTGGKSRLSGLFQNPQVGIMGIVMKGVWIIEVGLYSQCMPLYKYAWLTLSPRFL